MALRLTSRLCGLLVNAIRQLTQSVNVVTCWVTISRFQSVIQAYIFVFLAVCCQTFKPFEKLQASSTRPQPQAAHIEML